MGLTPDALGLLNPQPQDYPQSPDMGGPIGASLAGTPPPPQQKPGGLRNALKNIFLGALSGAAQAGEQASGITENQLQKAQIGNVQAQTAEATPRIALIKAQANLANQEAMMNQRKLDALNSMANADPFSTLGDLSPDEQALASVARNEAKINGDPKPIHDAIKQIVQNRSIWGRATRGETAITPEMAATYNIPKEMIGKPITPQGLGALMRGESFQYGFVQGAAGPYSANKVTGQSVPVVGPDGKPVGNAGIAVAQARARAAAQYGIAITDSGDTVSRLDALQQGLKLASGNPLIKEGLKGYSDAYTTDLRLKQMQQQAQDQSGASDMALLFNHIAMTGGNVKGMRMGELLTREHMKARSIPEDLGVLYNHAVNGETLSPQQRQNFLRLANEVRNTTWQKAAIQGKTYGINPTSIEQDPELPPVDLSGVGSSSVPPRLKKAVSPAPTTNTGGIKIIRDANGKIVGVQ